MKRLREGGFVNSQTKRPSRGESHGQQRILEGEGLGGTTKKLTTHDALTYLKEVKEMFQDQREKYDMFLDVMKDFKAQSIETTGVIGRVKELFKGHNNLIFGFNTFLPKGFEITLTDVEEAPPKKTVEFDEAISFIAKIKIRFQNDDHIYKSFLDILNLYRKEHKQISVVYQEVSALFHDHPDLLEEFKRFLPDASAAVAPAAPASHIVLSPQTLHHYDERSSGVITFDQQQGCKDWSFASQADHVPSVEPVDLDDNKTVTKLHKDQKKHVEKENKERKKNCERDFKEHEDDGNRDSNTQLLVDKKKSSWKVEDFGGPPMLSSHDDKEALNLKDMYNQEFVFCEKVKERLCNSDDYQAFLKCLHIYSTEIITRKELQSLVSDLLGKYPDLMDGFSEFLERCENIDAFLAGVMNKKSLFNEGNVSKSLKVEDRDKEQKRGMDGAKEKDRFKEKYMGKSIQDLDLSNCQSCTPSYRLLPVDYPIPSVSQRSKLGAQVLNDYWVSVTSGSEDYSFKHMRRNQYEESLFRCEDDRFELDMLLESVSLTAKRTEELLNNTNDLSIDPKSPICIEDHFTALNLRCIERLYGDHGLDVIDVLRKNPSLVLPVILIRLKQKQEEWTRCRVDFNKVWAEVYAKNHQKSLDHRSFYFKQQDSKNLSTKSLVAEIKEMKQKKQESNAFMAVATGSRHTIDPDMKFEYTDTDIHEDLYKLVKYSCEEVCSTKEQLNKVVWLWTSFLEPLLGVPHRSHGSEVVEVAIKPRYHAGTSSAARIGESDGIPAADSDTFQPDLSKTVGIGDVCPSLDQVPTSCRTILENGVSSEKGGFGSEKEQRNAARLDQVCGLNITVAPGESLSKAVSSGVDNHHGVTSIAVTSGCSSTQPVNAYFEDGHEAKANIDDLPFPEGADVSKPIPLTNVEIPVSTKVNRYHKDSVESSILDKEEGELSPTTDVEEENFVVHGNGGSQVLSKTKHGAQSRQYIAMNDEDICSQDVGENDIDAEDEVDESAGDECLRKEHEEEDESDDVLDSKVESECEADGMADAQIVGGHGSSLQLSERFLVTEKPLAKHVSSAFHANKKKDARVFYGNNSFYVLFRLHRVIYERLLAAKMNSASSETKGRIEKDSIHPDFYARFIRALYNLLEGSADNAKFEDECRAIPGNQSYVLFTLDKLIYKLVKQLQTVTSEEIDNKLLQLYEYEKSRKPEKYVDSVYYENAHVVLYDENIYRFECSSAPSCLSIQLMDDGNEKPEVVPVSVDPNFVAYLHNDFLSVVPAKKEPRGIWLERNKRKYADRDEFSSACMEGVRAFNGLECKMACNSFKISYVLDTEDFFYRPRRRKVLTGGRFSYNNTTRVERFHKFLAAL